MATATEGRVPPGIVKWHMCAGGTGEAHGRHGYSWHTEHGGYHVWPVSRGNGRPNGYVLRFANQPKAEEGGVWIGPGLWHDLGQHRSPAAAAKAAREHHQRIGRVV